MSTTITDTDLLAIESSCVNLQNKLNAQPVKFSPTCYAALQLKSDWTQQEDSPGPHGTCPITPGTIASPMEVTFTPAKRAQGQPWDNAYIMHRNSPTAATSFAYILNVVFPTTADIANCEAFEFELQHNLGPTIFNMAWQYLFGTGWRVFNYVSGVWEGPVIPATPNPFMAGVPARIVALFNHDTELVTHVGLSINGVFTPLDIVHAGKAQQQNPYLNNAVQIDSKGQGAPISLQINECTVIGV